MLPKVSPCVPILLKVIDWGVLLVFTVWLPNERPAGDRPRAGAVPVPDSATVCGLPGASSAIVTNAAFAPAEAGAKVTVTMQLAFTASVVLQDCVFEN